MPGTAHVSLLEALSKGPPPAGNLAVPIFAHGSLEVEMYRPEGIDPQKPHDRDEVYLVARGTGLFAAIEVTMDDKDFEGTLVLELLAAIGKVDDFFDAIDSDDVRRATRLMKEAKVDASTIATVIEKMEDADGEH